MIERVVKDEWYPVAMFSGLDDAGIETALMETPITIHKPVGGPVIVKNAAGESLPSIQRYGHVWSSLGSPAHDLFSIPEAKPQDRRLVDCGPIIVACSPLRAVENFLDIAHFPFIHTDILGVEDHAEVEKYDVEIDETLNEIWARKVRFFQPQAASSAQGGIMADYMYRVPSPTVGILYKTCPAREGEWDVITLFVQPLSETTCQVWPWMALYDDETPQNDLIHFQQTIFMQDRSILENQIPRQLPLDPKMEIPTRADLTSVAYRRWLKKRGYFYGAQLIPA